MIIGTIGFIYGYAKLKQLRKAKESEKARYISLYSKRESGDEVLGKHYAHSQKLSIPKTDKELLEDIETNTDH